MGRKKNARQLLNFFFCSLFLWKCRESDLHFKIPRRNWFTVDAEPRGVYFSSFVRTARPLLSACFLWVLPIYSLDPVVHGFWGNG